jgi:hypothetical protein
MKSNFDIKKSVKYIAGFVMVVFVSSCASTYDNSSVLNDGIYANDTKTNTLAEQSVNESSKGLYYQNYFSEQDQLISQAMNQNEVFTDIDGYSSADADVEEEELLMDENDIEYRSFGGWGTQPTSVSINVIDTGIWGPTWGWGGFGWNNFWGPGWGWNGFWGAGWGWNGFYGPGWGWGWNNFHNNSWAFHNNYRANANILNRGRSNMAYSRGDSRSNRNVNSRVSNTNTRSRLNANSRSSRQYASSDGRRIRNSSNINARTRSTRSSNATTTRRTSRSSYYNPSSYRNSSVRGSSSRATSRTYNSGRSRSSYKSPGRTTLSRGSTRSSGSRSVGTRSSSSRSSGTRSSGSRSSGRGGRR